MPSVSQQQNMGDYKHHKKISTLTKSPNKTKTSSSEQAPMYVNYF